MPGLSCAGVCFRLVVAAVMAGGDECGGSWSGRWRGSGRPGCEAGECPAAAFAGFRGKPGGRAAGVFLLAGVPGCQDALVADGQHGGDEQHQGGQAHEAAPAAADVAGGGGFGGGEAALGAGAAGVGAAPGRGRVVVFLPGLAFTSGGTVIVCWVQQAWGCPGGCRICGRSRSRVIETARSGQRMSRADFRGRLMAKLLASHSYGVAPGPGGFLNGGLRRDWSMMLNSR